MLSSRAGAAVPAARVEGPPYRRAFASCARLQPAYRHDVSGNVTHEWQKAPGTGTGAAPNGIHRVFRYDGLYRLTRANGREAARPPAKQP